MTSSLGQFSVGSVDELHSSSSRAVAKRDSLGKVDIEAEKAVQRVAQVDIQSGHYAYEIPG